MVLITSDSLGQTVANDSIPLAGKELMMAKQANERFRKNPRAPNRDQIEGNRHSVLAPPLGAIYSSSLGWRPRPFYDRPPGMLYGFASPLKVTLDDSLQSEALVCSLTLYSLGPTGQGRLYGKMSEEFYFPAGAWEGKIRMDSARREDGKLDMDMIHAWQKRSHKAIFSYDPLLLNEGNDKSLYIVMQGYRIISPQQDGEGRPSSATSGKKKGIGNRIKKKFGKFGGKGVSERLLEDSALTDLEGNMSSDGVFEKYAAQLLVPVCFGVTPFCPNQMFSSAMPRLEKGVNNEKMRWPNGSKQLTHLYHFPVILQDHDRFVECITTIAEEERLKEPTSGTIAPHADSSQGAVAFVEEELSPDEGIRKGLFQKIRSSRSSKISEKEIPLRVIGRASIFTSFLGTDFTQSMLSEPFGSSDESRRDGSTFPRLLVDVSGDCAIAVNPVHSDNNSTASADSRRRSNLIRLPRTPIPSGYIGASEFREIQFLPPRFEKQYDIDIPASLRSMQNLLYLYPRHLRFPSRVGGKKPDASSLYAVRVRLMKSSGDSEDGKLQPVASFFSVAPWAGSPVLEAAYTRVIPSINDPSDNSKDGVFYHDEIKMRLPMIVDGSYHLHFSLVEVDVEEGGVALCDIAETTIPLSSSSTREASSGVRVTTIIPNGSHRLKLGECQLQFETRLVSSIHVADPTTATALRDFPYINSAEDRDDDEKYKTLSLVPSRSVVGMSSSSEPIVDLKIPFHQLFKNASDSTLLGHFPLFMFMHLCNLVNHDREGIYVSSFLSGDESDNDKSNFLMDNLQSLFELLRKVKLKIVSRSNESTAVQRVEAFVKDLIDSFDENILAAVDGKEIPGTVESTEELHKASSSLKLERSRSEQSAITKDIDDAYELDGEEKTSDGGGLLHKKDTVRAAIDSRISKTMTKLTITGTPLARVAYGATKTDRWRAEAEHYEKGARFSHLVDDEETVITALYSGWEKRADIASSLQPSATWGGIEEENGSVVENENAKEVKETTSFVDTELAKRVRLVAQTMIAPCIAPEAPFSKGTESPPQYPKFDVSDEVKKRKEKVLHASSLELGREKISFVLPGSDVDDNDASDHISRRTDVVMFRGESSSVMLPFSYGHHREKIDALARIHAYEPIMGLWLKAWIHHDSRASKRESVAFPTLKLWEEDSASPIYGFYAHLDVILPLCLKSMILRCAPLLPDVPSFSRVILDTSHMEILYPIMGVLASSLLGEANAGRDIEEPLVMALASTDTVLDFLVGLASILHPQQLAELLHQFFKVLREAEAMDIQDEFHWTRDAIRNVRSSRQIRLRAVERFSAIGTFVALNFPLKFTEWKPEAKKNERKWTKQSSDADTKNYSGSNRIHSDIELLPKSGWLADLLATESLLICSLSCEAFVTEAIAHMETTQQEVSGSPVSKPTLRHRPGKSLTKEDLLLFQSIGLHAVTCVHELVIRRHAMDSRFQTERSRSRVASLFVVPVLEKSASSARWLARMQSTHKIRSLWLVCLSYILQEAPETTLRAAFRSYCLPEHEFSIHRIIRLLRLSSSTFQCLVDESTNGENSLDPELLPWLLQESFNSICASIILIIDECTSAMMNFPRELKKMAQGTCDLLLHILTVPQSAVTHLRTVGGALQALDKFGVDIFVEVTGDNLQHWIRIMLTLMNSISLSVRSIAVDFVISLMGETFKSRGSISNIAIVFATVLPEVVAREIALYSVEGLVKELSEVEQALWPMRRAFSDIEGANPLDDDRVDHQLPPILSEFCRSCQAIIDGVIVELKLRHPRLSIVGTNVSVDDGLSRTFDADEESLFEAANFFTSEASPMQRLRWLSTLKSLHEAKRQWVEAAETLMLCAKTISDSLPHLRHVWMPSDFILWNETKRSPWLDTIGQDQGFPNRGNQQVMEFASCFLQPVVLFGETSKRTSSGKLSRPSVHAMCNKLMVASKQCISFFLKESGYEELAFSRLQSLLRVVMVVVEDHTSLASKHAHQVSLAVRRRIAEEAASLRKVSATLNSDMTKLAEKLLLVTESESKKNSSLRGQSNGTKNSFLRNQYYVRVTLSGAKPKRFLESTSIPTYLEWDNPCVCRVPEEVVSTALSSGSSNPVAAAERICNEFGKPLRTALGHDGGSVMFRIGRSVEDPRAQKDSATYLDISMVHVDIASVDAPLGSTKHEGVETKRFLYRKSATVEISPGTPGQQTSSLDAITSSLVELTVARPFPGPLSRQRTLLTSEFVEGSV
jgi:hypothetical protein